MPFNLQGHRGARGLKPENTLPGFETAFDLGVSSIETDVQLSEDGVPILFHDAALSERLCRRIPGSTAPDPATRPLVRRLTLTQLRRYRADVNPDVLRFPDQDARVTPLAALFAEHFEIDPYTPPTVADLFAFAKAYAGALGQTAGKSDDQRARAAQVIFDLEVKRVPFRAELTGDRFDGPLERRLVDLVRTAELVDRVVVRSFDHRCVRTVGLLEPRLTTAVLVAGTAPVAPDGLAQTAGAQLYCPDVEFLDEWQIRECHLAGLRVLPWTVNAPADWQRLLAWGVDGITTDFPDQLAEVLRQQDIAF